MSGKFIFFQGQGIVREFCDVSEKNEILQKCQGNVREFYILTWWSWNVLSWCIFFAKFIKFSAPVLSGKFEFVSRKCQGIVKEFWSVLMYEPWMGFRQEVSAGLGLVGCACDWWLGCHRFDARQVQQHSLVEIDHEIFSAVIISSADSRKAVASFWQKNVHKYWLTA